MSWPQWPSATQPAVPSVLNPATPVINSAPAVVPPGMQYTPEQWAQLQQQNWNQWAQWQQQYQQWHQQYGAEYQKSINALAQAAQAQQAALPNVAVPPPLPAEPKPPLPTEDPPPPVASYNTAPPPVAQPPIQQQGYNTAPPPKIGEQRPPVHYPKNNQNWHNQNYRYGAETHPIKRGYDQPTDHEPKRPMMNRPGWQNQPPPQARPRENVEELSEAEKKFDKQFAEWEAQFQKWKEQNAEHPDKEQYREYEKKWESWRAQLLERREQMKRKRLGLPMDPSPRKSGPGQGFNQPNQSYDSPQQAQSGYNQGFNQGYNQPGQAFNQPKPLIAPKPGGLLPTPVAAPFGKPLPNLNDEPLKFKDGRALPEPEEGVGDFIKPNTGGGIPGLDLVKDDPKPQKENDDIVVIDPEEKKGPDLDAISKGINSILGDQKLLSMLSMVSQTQIPKVSDNLTNTVSSIKDVQNPESNSQHPPYPEQSNQSYEEHSNHSEGYGQREFVNNFDDQTRSSFTMAHTEQETRFEGPGHFGRGPNQFPDRFDGFKGREGDRFPLGPNQDRFGPRGPPNDKFGPNQDKFGFNQDRFDTNQDRFGPNQDRFGFNQDRFGPNQDKMDQSPQDRFGPNHNRGGPNQERFGANQGRFGPNQDRFGPGQDRFGKGFGAGQDRFGPNQDKFGHNQDRFGPNQDRFGPNQDKFGPNQDRFGPNQDRFGSNKDRFGPNQDKFGPNQDRFGPNQDRFGPNQDRAGPNQDRFGPNHDKFGPNKGRFGPGQNQDRFGTNQDRFGPRNDRNVGPRPSGGPKEQWDSGDNYNQAFDGQYEENCDDYDYDSVAANFETDDPVPPVQKKTDEPWKRDSNHQQKYNEPAVEAEPVAPEPPEIDDIFQATTVIDYEHKSVKPAEPEVLIEPIFMFDYRHKTLSRIPLRERPKWLSEAVRGIREFDPPVVRPYEPPRRYPPPSDNWRNDGYQKNWSQHRSRSYEDRPPYDDRRPYSDRSYEESRNSKNDWNSKKPYEKDYYDDRKPLQSMDFEEEKISDTEWPDDDELEEIQQNDQDFQKFQKPPGSRSGPKAMLIEDLISPPGRYKRPPRIVIILRGPPGSGKTFLAKLIKDKEVENGGSAPRILSLDDYFMVEQEKEVTEEGKKVKVKEMVYEYEAEMEESYRTSLIKSFKKTITDGYFSFIIVDNVNDKVKYFGEMWSYAKQNGFQVYICQLDLDVQTCSKRNIHGRSEADIEKCVSNWEPTPSHHPVVDATSLLQAASIPDVEMEEVNSPESDVNELDGTELNSTESTNRSDTGPWKSTSNWTQSGPPSNPPDPVRREFGGPIWKNRNNKRR